MKLRHILVEQRFAADDVERLLKRGEDFSQLAKRYSTCSSAQVGGDLGEIPLERLDREFADAARRLRAGEVSPIVRTRFGYHLILREK